MLLPETYLMGCGIREINYETKKSTTFVCSFYPSLLKGRGYFAYKTKDECQKECKECTQKGNSPKCDTIKCIDCKVCAKKGTMKFPSLCGKYYNF